MSDLELLVRLNDLSKRFLGVDIQHRRDRGSQSESCESVFWSGPWRARLLTSKNERESYRVTVYGKTFGEAVLKLLESVDRNDARIREITKSGLLTCHD